MGDGDPPERLRQFLIAAGPEQEVPVIRHQAIGREPEPGPLHGFGENPLKGDVVRRLLKQRQSTDTAIENVIGQVSGSEARAAGHADCVPVLTGSVKKRLPTPFPVVAGANAEDCLSRISGKLNDEASSQASR